MVLAHEAARRAATDGGVLVRPIPTVPDVVTLFADRDTLALGAVTAGEEVRRAVTVFCKQ